MITNSAGEKFSAKEKAKEILFERVMADLNVDGFTEKETAKILEQFQKIQTRLNKMLSPK